MARCFIAHCATLALSFAVLSGASSVISADDARFVARRGRTFSAGPGGVGLSWLGGGIRVNHSGSVLRVTATSASQFGSTSAFKLALYASVFSNEGPASNMPLSGVVWIPATGANETFVATALPVSASGSVANVILNMPADYWNCGVAQNGCSVSNAAVLLSLESDGEFLPAPSPPSRVIHVLGDSITAATNVRGGFNQCGDRTSYADYADSWAGLLCAFFDASCSTVAVGGKGLVRNCCDNGTTVPEYYTQLKKNDPVGSFGFDDAPPSAIIVYLGTNDYNKGVLPGLDQAFADAYVALIANISERYYGSPSAPLNATFFAVLGPMSPFYPQNATLAAVAEASTRGYRVVFVNATTACGANLTGCTDGCASHPGMAGHRNIATIVAAAVESAMGWPSPGVL